MYNSYLKKLVISFIVVGNFVIFVLSIIFFLLFLFKLVVYLFIIFVLLFVHIVKDCTMAHHITNPMFFFMGKQKACITHKKNTNKPFGSILQGER